MLPIYKILNLHQQLVVLLPQMVIIKFTSLQVMVVLLFLVLVTNHHFQIPHLNIQLQDQIQLNIL